MASKGVASLVALLFFFTLVTSTELPYAQPPYTPSLHHKKATCPKDIHVCADLLNLVHLVAHKPLKKKSHCCSLIKDLNNLESAVCLCNALKANVLGENLNVPVSLKLLLNECGKKVPCGLQCA